MKRMKIIGIVAVLTLVAAACGGGDDDPAEPTGTTGGGATAATGSTGSDDPLAEFGESTDADPALVEKAMGPVGEVPDIVLASIARANQELDQATIDKALECWSAPECDTGSGGDITMGYADGGGLNVWRQVTRMEAILQALTYPDIGRMLFRDAQWNPDPAVAAGDIRFLIQAGVDFIIGYPDQGTNIADAILEAKDAGIPYTTYSAGWVGLPEQEGALIPGTDYLSVVGEDLCALGESFAQVINDGVGSGKVGVMGGTPGNALSLGWQQCFEPALTDGDLDAGSRRHVLGERHRAPDGQRVALDGSRHQGLRLRVRGRAQHGHAGVRRPGDPGITTSRSRCGPTSRPCSAPGRR